MAWVFTSDVPLQQNGTVLNGNNNRKNQNGKSPRGMYRCLSGVEYTRGKGTTREEVKGFTMVE